MTSLRDLFDNNDNQSIPNFFENSCRNWRSEIIEKSENNEKQRGIIFNEFTEALQWNLTKWPQSPLPYVNLSIKNAAER